MSEADVAAAITFEPPGWGTWQQDRAHNPEPVTRLSLDLFPDGFGAGFGESFELFGMPIQSMTTAGVNGYPYMRMHFVGEPGPEGPPSPEEIGALVEGCERRASAAFAGKVWRDVMRRWDGEIKPAGLEEHLRLAAVELPALDDVALAEHVRDCMDHHRRMVYQHHRFNTSALVPVGDFAVQAARLTGRAPESLLRLFEGSSQVSGVWSDEIAPAALAIAADEEAVALLRRDGDPADRLARLCERLPEVDAYVRLVRVRLVDGFDLTSPTLAEMPTLLLGKLAAAVELGGPADLSAVASFEAEVRADVPADQVALFDELLAEARLVYRLRDERGLYSDMYSAGLLRLALLELGRRLVTRGVLDEPTLLFDADADEVIDLAKGATTPGGAELRARADARRAAAALSAPPFLGPPPPPPPPPEAMPPAVARVSAAMGFVIPAVLGEVEEPSADGDVIVGMPGNGGVHEGRARVILRFEDLATLEPGDVLVSKTTGEAFNSAIHLVGAIVTDHGGVASHAAIVAREVGIPAVVGTGVASSRIADGAAVVVDGTTGQVTIKA